MHVRTYVHTEVMSGLTSVPLASVFQCNSLLSISFICLDLNKIMFLRFTSLILSQISSTSIWYSILKPLKTAIILVNSGQTYLLLMQTGLNEVQQPNLLLLSSCDFKPPKGTTYEKMVFVRGRCGALGQDQKGSDVQMRNQVLLEERANTVIKNSD